MELYATSRSAILCKVKVIAVKVCVFKPKGDSDLPMLFPGKRCLVVGGGWLRPVSLTHPLYSKTLMTQDQK